MDRDRQLVRGQDPYDGSAVGRVAQGDAALTAKAIAAAHNAFETAEFPQRCVDTLLFRATEARKLTGGTVPMAASAAGVGELGAMLRVPYGVVGAISPPSTWSPTSHDGPPRALAS